MFISAVLGALLVAGSPSASAAPSPSADPARVVDVSNAEAVAALLREAGYKGEVRKGDDGENYVVSSAGGSEFRIVLYGCTNNANCDSIQFTSWFKKEPFFSPALANEWNKEWRFLKVAIDKDGDLSEYMDVSSVGKMTFANFKDYIDWYETMDAKLTTFLNDKRKAAGGK